MTEIQLDLSPSGGAEPVNLQAPPPLPKFRCHKVVQAALIAAIQVSDTHVDLILDPSDGRDQFVHRVSHLWARRHLPEAGGYLVRHENGYESYSPARAFEQGCSRIQAPPEAAAQPPARILTDHQVNPANDKLVIEVLDQPGAGGACHLYQITGFDTSTNPSCPFVARYGKPAVHSTVLFQNGVVAEAGVNGVTNEALLAILIDRMRLFQAGPYPCRENALALTKLEEALHWLHHRARARMARGVEGTHQK